MRRKSRHLGRVRARENYRQIGKVHTREVYVHRKRMCEGRLRAYEEYETSRSTAAGGEGGGVLLAGEGLPL